MEGEKVVKVVSLKRGKLEKEIHVLDVIFFTHLNIALRRNEGYLKLLAFVTETSSFILYHL